MAIECNWTNEELTQKIADLQKILDSKSIEADAFTQFRSMDIYCAPGTKVMYMNKNGYDDDREQANVFLEEGSIYTVDYVNIGSFTSSVKLKEFPGRRFNTVMFNDVVDIDM